MQIMMTKIIPHRFEHISFNPTAKAFLGEGLFETIRVHQGNLCCVDDHWRRMNDSAQRLNIPFTISLVKMRSLLTDCVQETGLKEGGIKVILASDSSARGLSAVANGSMFWMQSFEYNQKTVALKLIRAPWLRDARNPIYQHKSLCYLESIEAQRFAKSQSADDVLFFNTNQQAAETTIANFFLIINNTLVTPSLDSGILPGIMRCRLLELAAYAGILCEERKIYQDCIRRAEAAFVTNSLIKIQPVCQVNEQKFDTVHPLFRELLNLIDEC